MVASDMKQALVGSLQETLPMFGINPEYVGETEEDRLESASQVNILIGLKAAVSGNIVIGLGMESAHKVVSMMMGGMEITALDPMAKSALGELANMVIGSAMAKLGNGGIIDISPPTLVTGKKIFIMLSRLKAYKLTFKANGDYYDILFSLE